MARPIPRETDKRPSASWSNGKEIVGTDRMHRGWFIDCGLDAHLDAAATAAGWEAGGFIHLDGETRVHWLLPNPCDVFVLIEGVPYTTMAALVRQNVASYGLRALWPRQGRSQLAVYGIPADLAAQNYLEPLMFSVRSTSTDDLLAALLRHNAVLDACEAAARERKPRTFEFWEVALRFAPGAKQNRGREQTSPITCAHPDQPSVEYLRSMYAARVISTVWDEHRPRIVEWAAQRTDEESTSA